MNLHIEYQAPSSTNSALKFLTNVNVTKIDNGELPSSNVNEFYLKYPQHWRASLLFSPFALELEKMTIEWMRQVGVIPSALMEKYVLKISPSLHSCPVSTVPLNEAFLYVKTQVFGTLWDDLVVEKTTNEEDVVIPLRALAGEEVEMKDVWVEAMKHIGEEYVRLGATDQFRKRLSAKMIEWASASLKMSEMKERENIFEEILALRKGDVAMQVTLVMIERNVEMELPDMILDTEVFKKLVDVSSLIVAIMNDLMSLGKDIANEEHHSNSVLCHTNQFRCTLKYSCEEMIIIHDKAVKEFDIIAGEILEASPVEWKERVGVYLLQVRYTITGLAFLHMKSPRHHQYIVYEHGVQFVVKAIY